jgi:alpha-tubulin suppressor-like RCC1 family protein
VLATPTLVNLSGSVNQISTQLDHTCVVKGTNGQVSCWGWNRFGQTGQSPNEIAVPGAAMSSLEARVDMPISVSVGGTHTCAIVSAGSAGQGLYCWGDRSTRQVSDGLITSTSPSVPSRATFIDPAGTADRILTGRAHSCAAKGADGTVSCAGANLSLQLGMTPPSSTEPVGLPPVSLGPLDALFGGGDRACALVTGTLKCWGANDHGQLGNNSTVESATPVSPQPF